MVFAAPGWRHVIAHSGCRWASAGMRFRTPHSYPNVKTAKTAVVTMASGVWNYQVGGATPVHLREVANLVRSRPQPTRLVGPGSDSTYVFP